MPHRALELTGPLLVPRVSGTPENIVVRNTIVNFFRSLGWHVAVDEFTTDTVVGPVSFANIIATQNPDASQRLVLAAHYDSKDLAGFVGATDSAVPCAMLMDIAESLPWNSSIMANKASMQMVFFDGEEAFVHWSPDDSIYGARHLADVWAKTGDMSKIDALVLLDLIGARNPIFHNYHQTTDQLFRRLATLEKRLYSTTTMFDPASFLTYRSDIMQDDHLPFLERGVRILHLIPYPFPDEWHTVDDNLEIIDPGTVEALIIIFKAFVAEYFELGIPAYFHDEL
ncbi:glutaminyl-peptide cyclotransferase, isoform CRA_b [Dichotomocladium elegans]|nr:glutaminyl-peptide cyclotransferase, isoform CRA_b [Dichotomocladium elegans]